MGSKWILLRGLTRGNGHWGEFPTLLRDSGSEVELMEIPGNGTQNKVITPTTASEVIDQIKKRSVLLKSNERVNICGISLGGMIALKWVELNPDNINSVVTINTSLSQFSPFYERLIARNYFQILKSAFETDALIRETQILRMTSNRQSQIEKYAVPFSEFSNQYKVFAKNLFRQLVLAGEIRIEPNPFKNVLVVYSEKDRFVSSKCSKAIANEFKYMSASHPTAGHDLPLDEPQWLLETIDNFFQR